MYIFAKVLYILTFISSLIGCYFIFYFAIADGAGSEITRIMGMLFGVSLGFMPFIFARTISEINHLSHIKLSSIVDRIDDKLKKD